MYSSLGYDYTSESNLSEHIYLFPSPGEDCEAVHPPLLPGGAAVPLLLQALRALGHHPVLGPGGHFGINTDLTIFSFV